LVPKILKIKYDDELRGRRNLNNKVLNEASRAF
jgi:hypothetical protein